jgi:hypothetical protein
MKPTLYLETTIPSFQTGRPSRDNLIAGQQAATKKRWRLRRNHFESFTSQFVVNEAAQGDAKMPASYFVSVSCMCWRSGVKA